MAWTQKDIDALENAIKQGAMRVKFADREITYRSLDEMIELLAFITSKVKGRSAAKVHTMTFDRGYQ